MMVYADGANRMQTTALTDTQTNVRDFTKTIALNGAASRQGRADRMANHIELAKHCIENSNEPPQMIMSSFLTVIKIIRS